MNPSRIAVFVGTRADLGPLESILEVLDSANDAELYVLTGVAFDEASLTVYLKQELGLRSATVLPLCPPIQRVDTQSISDHGESLVAGANSCFSRLRFDALVVLGDRWELLFVVPQAYLHGIPIVHLHGGEITEGALDERVRHAVTKLADVHCVASEEAARRVRQLGEPEGSVFLTGAPGLDRVIAALPLSAEELRALFGTELSRPIALFTLHPPTAGDASGLRERTEAALRATSDNVGSIIITAPGFDDGREEILEAIRDFMSTDSQAVYVESLGSRFPRVLKSIDVMVGNSSAGIIEAPTAAVPSVDIGNRQHGRLRATSVRHAEEDYDSISDAIQGAIAEGPLLKMGVENPYRVGSAAKRILAAIHAANRIERAKPFGDLPVCMEGS